MLTIKNDYVNNYFNGKFIILCYVCYFINDEGRELTTRYICFTFYIFDD